LIDGIKPGAGKNNDDLKITAEITGLDFELVYRFAVILQFVSSGCAIDATLKR
jgi:hypothetical protein